MRLSALHVHPLKSARAVALAEAEVQPLGFTGDRRFMLVDTAGHLVSQRDLQALAQVTARLGAEGLVLEKDGERLIVRLDPVRRIEVKIWTSFVDVVLADAATNDALSRWFGQPLRLVYQDAQAERHVGAAWAGGPVPVSLADGYPVLLTTTGSLDALNRTLAEQRQPAVGMDRFRPNLVVDCAIPWDEDAWEAIEIGGIRFDLVKPCERCIMTTQDQMSGERIGGNPIQGLAVERMSADPRVRGVLFGWNLVPRGTGRIAVGDAVKVLGRRGETWPMRRREAR
ncbi:sulfurase [Rhizobium rhizosphaerae]|uniref:Sulfurase n=1 Tax=Xaviernesmea rhizosphaerae TaxID=1672749 RepID=A0A1Q9AKY5_9HYPH|nr:MOSC domain-containing protein [Xaviernesmea rhizosphaerae]OLP55968.1 sulfurase [Xaviernesmea rhizosphaerae]